MSAPWTADESARFQAVNPSSPDDIDVQLFPDRTPDELCDAWAAHVLLDLAAGAMQRRPRLYDVPAHNSIF